MNDLNLAEVDKYRLNEINKIKEYFNKKMNGTLYLVHFGKYLVH